MFRDDGNVGRGVSESKDKRVPFPGDPPDEDDADAERFDDSRSFGDRDRDARRQTRARGIFSINPSVWPRVCDLGLYPAIAYPILACGTGPDGRKTAWSASAVERYGGIPYRKAVEAVDALVSEGFVRLLSNSGGIRQVKYELILPDEPAEEQDDRHRLFWLPNTLVMGAAGERPPLKLLRQCRDPMTTRLCIELYGAQYLPEFHGVDPRLLRQEFERHEIGQRGAHVAWGFRSTGYAALWKGPIAAHRGKDKNDAASAILWQRISQLRDTGLLEFVPYLVEAPDGELMHPLGTGATDTIEDRLGTAAHRAACEIVTDAQYRWAMDQHLTFLAPVRRHIAGVQLIGVARLRYRTQTKVSAAWQAKMRTMADEYLVEYAKIGASAVSQTA